MLVLPKVLLASALSANCDPPGCDSACFVVNFAGLAVDCGHGSTSIAPVFNGSGLSVPSVRSAIGGIHVTRNLLNMLEAKSSTHMNGGWKSAERVKHGLCRVAQDYDVEMMDFRNRQAEEYELGDGHKILVDEEQISAAEIFFDPARDRSLGSVNSLPTEIKHSLGKCAKQLQKGLVPNIVVSGGSSLLPYFIQRVEAEVVPHFMGTAKVIPMRPEKREVAAWVGGSILGSLSTFGRLWISAQEHAEDPHAVSHRLGL